MSYTVNAYCIYLPAMVLLTIWVARTIHKNSKAFLLEIFPEHEHVALAVNNLLQVGFYLIALGFGLGTLKIYSLVVSSQDLVEELATKQGGFTLFCGALLFFNLFLMLILRRNSRNARLREERRKTAMPYPTYQQHFPNGPIAPPAGT